jgi:hypothetical protein
VDNFSKLSAKKYAEYRNKFAHDQPLLRQQGLPPRYDILMVDGKGQFQPDEVKQQYIGQGVPVDEITYAAGYFRELANLTRDFLAQVRSRSAWLDILRERLRRLPNLPRKEGLFQPFGAPTPPPAPSQE